MKSSLTLNHSYHSFNSLDEHDLIIDLTEFITNLSFGNALGYYFADEQENIITGKVITSIGKNLKTTQITIPATEIPEQAVTLSFFVD